MAKTDKDMLDDQMLDAFFDAARSEVTEPSTGLVSAILADAAAHQPGAAGRGVSDGRDTRQQPNVWSRITSAIGGWPALAGMATATLAGVWIGFAAPTQLETLSGGLVLSGEYATNEEVYALEDMAPSYFGTAFLMEDDG